MSQAIIPLSRVRKTIYQRLSEPARQVLQDIEAKLRQGVQNVILTHYDIGARIDCVVSNPDEYGAQAIKDIAEYLNLEGGPTLLYSLRNFSRTFSREFVHEHSSRVMANGKYLTLTHWLKLAQVSGFAKQKQLLNKTIENGWSANDLEREVRSLPDADKRHKRSGGRRPALPKSPMAGLQMFYSIAQKLANYEPLLEEQVCPMLENLEPDRVSPELLEKLEATQAKIDEAMTRSQSASRRMQQIIQRMRLVLSSREGNSPAPATVPDLEDDDEAEPAPQRRRTPRKPSARAGSRA